MTFDCPVTATILVRSVISVQGSTSSRPSGSDVNQRSVAPVRSRELLPRHQVGVVLHLGDEDLVAGPHLIARPVSA